MKKILAIFFVGIFSIVSVSAQAKLIGMKRAKQIALAQANGKIKSSELEKEKGTTVYSFDIRNAKGGITEVLVDAFSGKVIEVKAETAAAEAREKREDAKKKQ
ncbi:MAG: PepSY domain-containing protein [Pyrinomonadaceae bacterium]|nr:PepSY domain-containing protein [Pyrinomonadaceae bacterium]